MNTEAYESILTRRSCRRYTQEGISEAHLRMLLDAAMSAPSARNTQPWHFIVATERGVLNTMAEIIPYGKMLKDAPLGLVVCGDRTQQARDGYLVQDCSAATQNILLAAHALGLGAVWLGVYPREDRIEGLRELFRIPEDILPIAAISVGVPMKAGERAERYREDRVHRNQWD